MVPIPNGINIDAMDEKESKIRVKPISEDDKKLGWIYIILTKPNKTPI